jgi:hypothetical protein
MSTDNKRYIDIDTNTRVGYNYIKQQFYVTNKEYTTYRNTLPLIREVLNSLDIPQDNPTDEDIQALKDYTEDLYKVSFTWQDTGAYIHTLQFNDFDKYPLTIDCEKQKLYIMNSTIIYDLTLNESPRNVRIPRILSFYKNTLGLLISIEDMRYFYSLLLSYYTPTCYNQIALNTETNKYFYNNKFILSNYNNSSNATYICTYNPNNTAQNTRVAYIVGADATANTLTAYPAITEEDLQGYNKTILEGADTTVNETEYTADGTYTIESIEGDTIKVQETIPYSYEFPYKECYVLSAQTTITKMERQTRQITLTNLPENVLTGDVILVSGATVTTEYETISCNGTYTVELIQGNTITVTEEIPTDFTGTATLIKEVFISNIATIRAKKLTLTTATDLNLENATVMVHTIGDTDTTIKSYTVSGYTSTSITVAEDILAYNYTKTCPQLYIPVPTPDEDAEVLIEITSVSENAETLMPLGEFMVDSFEQCQSYLGTLSKLVIPTENTKDNMYKELPTTYTLERIPDVTTAYEGDTITCSIESMACKGLYSKNYTEKGEVI